MVLMVGIIKIRNASSVLKPESEIGGQLLAPPSSLAAD